MKCWICKYGKTLPGIVTVTLTQDEMVFVFKGVPADVCQNCGEYYLSDEMTDVVLSRAEQAIENGSEVEIQRYGHEIRSIVLAPMPPEARTDSEAS